MKHPLRTVSLIALLSLCACNDTSSSAHNDPPKPEELTPHYPDSDILFSEDFETQSLDAFQKELAHDSSCVIQNDLAHSGKYAARFLLNASDAIVAGNSRAELVKTKLVEMNSEVWTGHALYFNSDYTIDENKDNAEIIYQWHEVPDWDLGEDWRSPPVYIMLRNHQWEVKNRYSANPVNDNDLWNAEGGTTTYESGPLLLNGWTEFLVRVYWSYQGDGILQVWKNGVAVANKRGPVCYNDKSGPSYKIGIYRPGFYLNPPPNILSRSFLLDDVSITKSCASVAVQHAWKGRLKEISVGGKPLPDFDPYRLAYEIEIPFGAEIPTLAAIPHNPAASYQVFPFTDPQNKIENSFVVSVREGESRLDYLVSFVQPRVRLKGVLVNGTPLADFDPTEIAQPIKYKGETPPTIEPLADADCSVKQGRRNNGSIWVTVQRESSAETYWFIFSKESEP